MTSKPTITDLAHTDGHRDHALLTDAKRLKETPGDPEMDGLTIYLTRVHDGWKASSKLGGHDLEATGWTWAQALRELTRAIHRHFHRNRQARRIIGDLTNVELIEATVPRTSTSPQDD